MHYSFSHFISVGLEVFAFCSLPVWFLGFRYWQRNRKERLNFENLFEISPDAIFMIRNGAVLDCNSAAVKLMAAEVKKDLIGKEIFSLIHEDSHESVKQRTLTLNNSPIYIPLPTIEQKLISLNGNTINVEATPTLINYQGKPTLQIIIRDISRAKEAEKEIEENKSVFHVLADLSPEAIFIQTENKLSYVNKSAVQLLGAPNAEALLNSDVSDLFPRVYKKLFFKRLEYFQKGQTMSPLVQDKIVGYDGRELDVEINAATYSYQNKPQTQIVVRDISERKNMENKVLESIHRFQLLMDNAGDSICLLNMDGTITEANRCACERLGYSKEEYLKFKYFEIFISLDADQMREVFDMMAAGMPIIMEGNEQRKDGKTIPVETQFGLMVSGDEKSIVAISRDNYERQQNQILLKSKNAELEKINQSLHDNRNQLMQSEKMASLGQLAAGVAHEINNPMGFIASNLGTLSEYIGVIKLMLQEHIHITDMIKQSNATEIQSALDHAEDLWKSKDIPFVLGDIDQLLLESLDGSIRVKEIVQNLKSFAHVDEAELKEVNINDGIEATLKIINNEIKYKCELHKKLGALPKLMCHPGQLNQVFLNLIMNASQAIADKGVINVETMTHGNHILIVISDTGQGIAPENLSKLFTPFFTTKPVGKGTGLGLSISYSIIKKHGGDIIVKSKLGEGTTFTISLPLTPVPNP